MGGDEGGNGNAEVRIRDRKDFKGRIWIKEAIFEKIISNEPYRKDRWSMRWRAKLLLAAQYSVSPSSVIGRLKLFRAFVILTFRYGQFYEPFLDYQ